MTISDPITFNVQAHDKISRTYEKSHGEIYNPIEQARLAKSLADAAAYVEVGRTDLHALDLGCGSGNLTRHLLAIGFRVTAADVSPRFLDLIHERYGSSGRCETLLLNGRDLGMVPDASIDFVATYSVLHHVPDYLALVREMCRVIRPGGIVYIDHEVPEEYWEYNPAYRQFVRQAYAECRLGWRRYLQLAKYINRLRRIPHDIRKRLNPRYSPQGDIHVWPDDHIEWSRIQNVLADDGCEVVCKHDYLLFRDGYSTTLYEQEKERLVDMRCLVARKVPSACR